MAVTKALYQLTEHKDCFLSTTLNVKYEKGNSLYVD